MTPIGLLILATLAQTAPVATWKPVKPADGSFTAEMPGEVQVGSREIPDPQGAFHLDTFTVRTDEAAYSITALRFSGDIPEATRDATLDHEISKYLDAKRGNVIREGAIGVDGWPGWDMTIRGPEGANRPGVVVTRCWIVLSARTLYTITATSPVGRTLPDTAARFFRSFRFDLKREIADSTPEKAIRTFLGAMLNRDEATLDAVLLSSDGVDWLLGGPPLKAAQLTAARRQAMNGSIKILKAGDEYTPTGGKPQKVEPGEVSDDHALLLPQGAPSPTRLVKVESHWKVDAAPLIESRKAADASRGKAKPKSSKKATR